VRRGCVPSAVNEDETLRQCSRARSVIGIHPGDPGTFVVSHEARVGKQAQQLDVIVAGEHVDGVELELVYGFDRACPDDGKRSCRETGNDDGITAPTITPVREDDAGDRPVVVDPEALVDPVRAPRRSPPPLQIGRFPEPRVRVSQASALQELRRERQVLEARDPYLIDAYSPILRAAIPCTGFPKRMMGLEPTTFCMANRPSRFVLTQDPHG